MKIFITAILIALLTACGSGSDTTSVAEDTAETRTTISEAQVPATAPPNTVLCDPTTYIPCAGPTYIPSPTVTCNTETYIPCQNPPPQCEAGYVLSQGLCTLSICNYETYVPCAVPPPVCKEGETRIQGICSTVRTTEECTERSCPIVVCPQDTQGCPTSPAPYTPRTRPPVDEAQVRI